MTKMNHHEPYNGLIPRSDEPAKECPTGSADCKCTDAAHRAMLTKAEPAKEPGQVAFEAFYETAVDWPECTDGRRAVWRAVEASVLEAAGVERLRDDLAKWQARATKAEDELRGTVRTLDVVSADRAEQKARADRAEHILDAIDKLVGIECTEHSDLPGIVERTGDACIEAKGRLAALEKASREFADAYPWQAAPELAKLRAVLDAHGTEPEQPSEQAARERLNFAIRVALDELAFHADQNGAEGFHRTSAYLLGVVREARTALDAAERSGKLADLRTELDRLVEDLHKATADHSRDWRYIEPTGGENG